MIAKKILALPFLIVLISVLSGCNHKPEFNANIYNLYSMGFSESIDEFNRQILPILKKTGDSLSNPTTSSINRRWCENITTIHDKAYELKSFLNDLSEKIKIEANLTIVDGHESYKQDDFNSVITLFDKNNLANEIQEKMLTFKIEVMQLDTSIESHFENDHSIYLPTKKGFFFKAVFSHVHAIGAIAVLSKFENDIALFEYKSINYCNDKISWQ